MRMRRFLHVANGTCTTEIIKAARIPGALSIWADLLYEGPVPGGIADEELLEIRARYLSGSPDGMPDDPVNDLRRWRSIIEQHDAYDELVLWFEHDLFDQLNLIQILSWIRGRIPSSKVVSLVCIGSFPGRARFKGLGELTPDELASLLETRQAVSDSQYDLAERAWQAFRDSAPLALDELRQSDTSALPFLAAAIQRFLEEYPATRDGLSRSERRLLQLAQNGPIELLSAFPRMHDDEGAYYITDGSLAELADSMARTSPPLIEFADPSDRNVERLDGAITLASCGRDVLNGRQDRVTACGIDRWLGGVHLQAGAPDWRWDDLRERVVRR
jgi:hypothetical protein